MTKNYRTKKMEFISEDRNSIRTIYTPQFLLKGKWVCLKDKNTESGIAEFENRKDALEKSKILALEFGDK